MTIEELQAENLRLSEENTALKGENENYSNQVNDLKNELNSVRELNQQFYLKLRAQDAPAEEDTEEDDTPSCVEFAKTLTI